MFGTFFAPPGNRKYYNLVYAPSTTIFMKSLTKNCVQSPLRVAGKAVYVIDSERLALMSLPVMSPEVVRCVWDEHRRLRRRCSPPPIAARSRTTTSFRTPKYDPLNIRSFEEETRDLVESHLPRRDVIDRHCRIQALIGGRRDTDITEDETNNLVETIHQKRQGKHAVFTAQCIMCIAA